MNKRVQLFIFPYAGGSIAAMKRLTDLIDEHIEVITVEYAGRGTRAKEPLAENIWEFMNDAVAFCLDRRDTCVPYAVLGYSMGSILAYEILYKKAIPGELIHLFLSAEVSAKERSCELAKAKHPTQDRILERARMLGGLDDRMLINKRFSEIYIKPMISDYKLFFDYRFDEQEHDRKIHADTTFFYCENDTPLEEVRKWSELIDGKFVYYEMGDNHFFVNRYYKKIAELINETLVHCRGREYDV